MCSSRTFLKCIGNVDYDLGEQRIVKIPKGETIIPLNISIKPDDIVEENESFNLSIDVSSLPDDIRLGSPNITTVTIVDDDSKSLVWLYSVDVLLRVYDIEKFLFIMYTLGITEIYKISRNYVMCSVKSKVTIFISGMRWFI